MKSDKVKKIFLGILAVIAIVIWVRNIGIIKGSPEFYRETGMDSKGIISDKYIFPEIPYQKPRINPFKASASASRQTPSSPISAPNVNSSKKPPPSSIYIFDGFVLGSGNSQAILKSKTGQIFLIAPKDTVDGWVAVSIESGFIVFKSDQRFDTLSILGQNVIPEKNTIK